MFQVFCIKFCKLILLFKGQVQKDRSPNSKLEKTDIVWLTEVTDILFPYFHLSRGRNFREYFILEERMYKLNRIRDDVATRMIELQNEETGTIDFCFDDSALISTNNFEFMKLGDIYDCKIALLGSSVDSITKQSVQCEIIDANTRAGNVIFVKVLIGRDVYYIPPMSVKNDSQANRFFFEFTRKDIIQVNDVVHADLL